MDFVINAAAGCNKGRLRKNNEDNICFGGKTLPEINDGLRQALRQKFQADKNPYFAVFDGMGGEAAGEKASYLAACIFSDYFVENANLLISPKTMLEQIVEEMNKEICHAMELSEDGRMGSTAVSLYFTDDTVYIMNLGDSKAFLLRDHVFSQLSKDDLEKLPENSKKKPRLMQYLGIFEDELSLEPHIIKTDLHKGDVFLICSDGLTDMLTNAEICSVILESESTKKCVDRLIDKANQNGGKDNITAILCKVER